MSPAAAEPLGAGRTLVVGGDAALAAAAMGFMYALVTGAALGAGALPVAWLSTLLAFVVGGGVAAGLWRGPLMVASPNGTGVLIVAGMLVELQALPAAQGHLAVALLALGAAVVLCGLLQILFAALHIGSAMKFLPFPVVSGFTNTIALSLIVNMLPSALGHDYLGRLPQLARWASGALPGAVLVAVAGTAAGLLVRSRWPKASASLAALGAGAAVHHGLALALGAAVVGPTLDVGSSWLPALPAAPDWAAALQAGPAVWELAARTALLLAVLNSLFSLLTAASLLKPTDPPLDSNALLRALGLGNLAAGLCGGLPVAIVAPSSMVMRRHPVPQGLVWLVWLVYLAVLLLIFLAAKSLVRQLPLAAVAAAVFTAALGMLDAWSRQALQQAWARRGADARTWAHLGVSFGVAAIGLLFGLAAALFTGTLAAVFMLAVELRRSVVVGVADGRQRRSRRVRAAAESHWLTENGDRIRIVELGHWLYFGTVDELAAALDRHAPSGGWLLVDLHRVAGVEATAGRAFWLASQRLQARGTRLLITGLAADDARCAALRMFSGGAPIATFKDADLALEVAEDALMAEAGAAAPLAEPADVALPGLTPPDAAQVRRRMSTQHFAAGERLFACGDAGDALYVVLSGRVTLHVAQRSGPPMRLLTFGAGTMFGEMALLDGHARSTDAVAEHATQLLVLTRTDYLALAAADPALYAALTRALALNLVGRLRETTRLLLERD